jgi:Ca2+-transporting ATPase
MQKQDQRDVSRWSFYFSGHATSFLKENGAMAMAIQNKQDKPKKEAETGTPWHTRTSEEVLQQLGTNPNTGITSQVAEQRLKISGPNELEERGGRSPWRLLWEQFTATMVLILIAAGVISLFLQKWQEAIAIFAIVILFGLLGFIQEYRAERAMAALKKLAVPNVRVRRDGQVREISAKDLVPGDMVLLEAGNLVPADLRLSDAANLKIQEAALTGESEAVEKEIDALNKIDMPLGDRRNMAYMGTVVTYGRGAGLVVETGMKTELGKVATLLQDVKADQTPLQKRLDKVGKALAAVGIAVAALVALFGVLRGEALADMFLVAVSVAVAIVPEGLPAVVTITLALGARRMLSRNALIRKLPAVETLGSVSVICSDKTGTLTQNRMTVTVLDMAGHKVSLNEKMMRREPSVDPADAISDEMKSQAGMMSLLLSAGALVNDAQLQNDDNGKVHAVGDPTEGALVIAAAAFGLRKEQLEQSLSRVMELPFDSDRKRMTTVHELRMQNDELRNGEAASLISQFSIPNSQFVAFTKGSVDGLLDISKNVWHDGKAEPMTPAWLKRITAANAQLAQDGMRVLGVAFKPMDTLPAKADESLERDLTFIGLVGMIDPPRAEVKDAVATCRSAGVRPIMITGDHPLTAQAIAKELGITDKTGDGAVITGTELNKMTDAQLSQAVDHVSVFARVSPEHKLRIVQALQEKGHVAAMTGDGVNDAPALKKADIGVAMGITGTDVTKEAGEMVLRDDNFATIVSAVEEGRVIYDNIKKFVKFSIGGNIGKVMVMMLAPTLALLLPQSVLGPLVVPLLPLQLLWLNLLTDGLLGIGLGMQPAEKNVMRRPPISSSAGIFSGGALGQVIRMGLLIGAIALGVGVYQWRVGHADWQTMMFTTLAFSQVFQAMSIRSGNDAFWKAGLFSNKPLLALAVVVVVLQLAAMYVPFLQTFLGTTALTASDLLLCVALSSIVFIYAEIEKALGRRHDRKAAPTLQPA